jgi:hypothetical protein
MKKIKMMLLTLIISITAQAGIQKQELDDIFSLFHQMYDHTLPSDEVIIFNPPMNVENMTWWDVEMFRAAYHGMRFEDEAVFKHFIYLMGGLARTDFMTIDGVAIILCHEMGHGFGGAPYKISGVTSEGQSDYYSTGECLHNFFSHWPREININERSPKKLELCQKSRSLFIDEDECIRGLTAIETRVKRFAHFDKVQTSIFNKDPHITTEFNNDETFYPAHQCRIDTLMAGWFHQPRPKCWYAE